MSYSITLTNLADGIDVPHSMRNPSRLPSSMTFSVLNGLPSYKVSRIKSNAHTWLRAWLLNKGWRSRVRNLFLALRLRFSRMAQYTLCTLLWFQGRPSALSLVKHFQNPQRDRLATISLSASITGASLAARSTVGLYNADRENPTLLQALERESWWS